MEPTAFTNHEIQQFRAETSGTSNTIHFNNAGSSLPTDRVVDTVIAYLKEEAAAGGYETDDKYKPQLENTYNLIARLINAQPEEIAIVENASIAWDIAFYGIGLKKGDVVLTSEFEYVTNLIGLLNLQKTAGIEIKVIPNDAQGRFSLAELKAAISPKTKLIAVTHIPSTAGGMLPVVEIGELAREHNILYLVDACQSVGQVPIDVKEMGCDMLAVTGRKYLRAPRGTGFLYVRSAIQNQVNPIFMDGFSTQSVTRDDFSLRPDAKRYELYESNRALRLGLGEAVSYILDIGIDKIWLRIQHLADFMRSRLSEIDGITVHDIGDQKCGIVTFSVSGIDSALVRTKLAEKHINVSVGLAKSTLFYMEKQQLTSIVRASVHYYNTEEEIKAMTAALTGLITPKISS
jgi:cysteine desulfurase / selenocysteine lyase